MALLRSSMENMGLAATASQLETALLQGATDMGEPGPDNDWGAGFLNVAGAYQWLLANVGVTQAGEVNFSAASFSTPENVGDMVVSLARSGGAFGEVTVEYNTTNAEATAGEDYASASGAVTFLHGETSLSFLINILDDDEFEGDERFGLTLSNPSGGATLGDTFESTVTIVDDDSAPLPLDKDFDSYTDDIDCNDNDATIYPGAPETKQDGIDQDCNGHDLTVVIVRARYLPTRDRLIVWATSELGDQARLQLTVHRQGGDRLRKRMNWNAAANRWERVLRHLGETGGIPESVTVSGIEGGESRQVNANPRKPTQRELLVGQEQRHLQDP
jgi:hypothetical protein